MKIANTVSDCLAHEWIGESCGTSRQCLKFCRADVDAITSHQECAEQCLALRGTGDSFSGVNCDGYVWDEESHDCVWLQGAKPWDPNSIELVPSKSNSSQVTCIMPDLPPHPPQTTTLFPKFAEQGGFVFDRCAIVKKIEGASYYRGNPKILTPQVCNNFCVGQGGTSFFGLRGTDTPETECWCGKTYYGIFEHDDLMCRFPCPGDRNQYCGGLNSTSVYIVSSIKKPSQDMGSDGPIGQLGPMLANGPFGGPIEPVVPEPPPIDPAVAAAGFR